MDDVDLEQRLDRFNGVFTAIVCAILPLLAKSDKATKKAIREAMQQIVESDDKSPATEGAKPIAQRLMDEVM